MLSFERFLRNHKILFLRTTPTGLEAAALMHGTYNEQQHPPPFASQYYETANKQVVLCRGDKPAIVVFPRTLALYELDKKTMDAVATTSSWMGLAMLLSYTGPDALIIQAGVPLDFLLAHAFIGSAYVALSHGSCDALASCREDYCRVSHMKYLKIWYDNNDDNDDDDDDDEDDDEVD